MGLNRELRTLNQNIATDKQLKLQEREEKKQLKDLQLLENAQKQHLQLYLKSKIQYYLDLNFAKYKNDLYLINIKNDIKSDYLRKNKSDIDIVFIYFDDFYYKILQQQIKMYSQNQKAIGYYIQQQQEVQEVQQQLQNIKQEAKSDIKSIAITLIKTTFHVLINCSIAAIGIFTIFCHPVNYKKRRF